MSVLSKGCASQPGRRMLRTRLPCLPTTHKAPAPAASTVLAGGCNRDKCCLGNLSPGYCYSWRTKLQVL